MKRKQVRAIRRGGFPTIFSTVLLTALALGSIAQAAPIAQIQTQSVYGMTLSPQDIKLCVGHGELFIVTVPLSETRQMLDGTLRTFEIYYSGEEITAEVRDEHVGTITPPRLETSVERGGVADLLAPLVNLGIGLGTNNRVGFVNSPQQLWFYFTAKEKGTTTIEFKHNSSFMRNPRAASLTAQVEVTDCWEAYATGLWTGNKENNWTKKDICSLERPFVIEGNGVSEAGEASTTNKSQAFFFWPMGEPFGVAGVTALQNGRYIYVGLSTVTAFGLKSSCTSVGSGTYEQLIYDSRHPREGNIILWGSADVYCEGSTHHINNEAIQVAFRALGAGLTCQESLPGLNP